MKNYQKISIDQKVVSLHMEREACVVDTITYYTTLVTLLWCVHGSIGFPQQACHWHSWAYFHFAFTVPFTEGKSSKANNFTIFTLTIVKHDPVANVLFTRGQALC